MIQEKVWRWMTDDGYNSPIVYANWGAGRPDNLGGNENCLLIHYRGARTFWDDENCNILHSFICETGYTGMRVFSLGSVSLKSHPGNDHS